MRVGSGHNTYEWIDDWARVPDSESAREGWAHPGIVVTDSGDVVTCHSGDPTVMTFDREGNLKSSWTGSFINAHGMALSRENGTEYLWIADNGTKNSPSHDYQVPEEARTRPGKAFKTTMDGQTVLELQAPDLPVYNESRYAPTSIAVNQERHGGNGDVWVADGYGAFYVHRFDKAGNYVGSVNGEDGLGHFNQPHGIFVDRRRAEPELYVSDRANHRVQVYDLEGNFKRGFGADFLIMPSGFATHGDLMVIAELRARLALTDLNDNLVGYLGANQEVCDVDGWPNNKNDRGVPMRSRLLETGKLNSPHGIAMDADGNVFVAEWLIGGRVTKLAKS